MRVLVTGGTGFVGSHSVAAFVSRGHQVQLLVRSRDRVARSLSPLGVAGVESVLGDATAPQSVEEAMAGCDAVLHAAAVYSLDPRAAPRVRETNLRAAEIVLGAAVRMGLDPVVHVSSYVALLPPEPPSAVLVHRVALGHDRPSRLPGPEEGVSDRRPTATMTATGASAVALRLSSTGGRCGSGHCARHHFLSPAAGAPRGPGRLAPAILARPGLARKPPALTRSASGTTCGRGTEGS
jgi:nucleoside-diphosphate-sugar epimerase